MKILTAKQIKAWDQYTIKNEPVSSIDLMERAAQKCVEWILEQDYKNVTFKIFCGRGNNGGDGLAIARMLFQKQLPVAVFVLESANNASPDFINNLKRLEELQVTIQKISLQEHLPDFANNDVIIDALFGSGLNKPLDDFNKELVKHINAAGKEIISIDVPSGMFIDYSSLGNEIIKADHTLTFQLKKLAFFAAENAPFFGKVHVLHIDLNKEFLENESSNTYLIDDALIKIIFKKRNAFSHKGTFGHCLIIAGSYGKMGAAVLAAKSCLRSGSGLVSAYVPGCGYTILQTVLPEAMVITDVENDLLINLPSEKEKYCCIGIGPGIGTDERTQNAIAEFIKEVKKPMVIDADGLNCIAKKREAFIHLPPYSILTPHPKEFDRLFGEHSSEFERFETARTKAKELNVIIVLKGHHTLIATPGGLMFFNDTGNAGMATAGSGDVLTGMITSFIGQGYEPVHAAILGIYVHGFAGDFAAKKISQEAMIASDIIDHLPQAFNYLNKNL